MAAILQQLFAQTDTGVVVVDRSHCILAWNPGAERMFGWLASEIRGNDVVDQLAPADSSLRRYVGAVLLGDVVQSVPVRLRQNSGTVSELILTCRGSGTQPNVRPPPRSSSSIPPPATRPSRARLRTHSLKASWSTGATVRLGGDFDTITLAWQTTLGW
jgi:PAS domain S-box-containing protein